MNSANSPTNENHGDGGEYVGLGAGSTDEISSTVGKGSTVGAGSPKAKRRSESESKVIAGLAVHLLPPETTRFHDARDVTAAVKLASRILEEASKPKKEYAYEIFPRNAVMSMKSIASTFKEWGWEVLNSPGATSKYVGQLLDSIYRDIQIRRGLQATALRQRGRRGDPGDETRVACIVIKNLLRDLGMDTAFGRQLDDAVGRFWHDLVDIWLKTDQQLKKDIEKIPAVSPTLFSEICVDSSYEEYAAARKPPDNLGTDGLLSVNLWLDGTFRDRFAGDGDMDDSLITLSTLNRWPEYLCPGESRYSNPFAECIAELARSAEERDGLQGKFDLGVRRFREIWARLMLIEFSRTCCSEPAIQRLQDIGGVWRELEPGERADISETVSDDPARLVECVAGFLRGGLPLSLMALPFHGGGVQSPALRPYARELDALLHGLSQVSQLAWRLNIPKDDSQEIENAVRAERARIIEMDATLMDPASTATQERVRGGAEVVQRLKSPSSFGRIKPHLLFRYAYDHSLLDELLVKKQ